MTLEQQLIALLETHGLTSLSINVSRDSRGKPCFYSYAHAGGLCGATSVFDRALVSEAIKAAINDLNAERISALPAMGEAA